LERDLNALVNRHSEWQTLDKVLRFLEQYGDPTFIPYHWETLQQQIAAVLPLESPEVQAALLAPAASLEQAVTAEDERGMLHALDALAHEVRLRFFDLDRRLKERCDSIQLLGAEFRFLLDLLTS
jgi:hypothetical protein